MNFTRLYHNIRRMPALLCMTVVFFVNLSAKGYGQQSPFDRFTEDRFLFSRQNTDGTDEDSETEMDREYDSDENPIIGTKFNLSGQHRPTEPITSDIQRHDKTGTKEAASERSYFIRYTHSVHKGARISTGISGRGYISLLQLTSPMPVPYFELSVKNFAAGLYPLSALQTAFPEKKIPTVFLGAGCLTFDRFLKGANFPDYSKIRTSYGGLIFPREQFIGIGSSQQTIQYGVEVSGSDWNGAFFASPEPKEQRMRYGLLGGWHTKSKKTGSAFAVQYLTAFIPELVIEVQRDSKQPAGVADAVQSADTVGVYGEDMRQRYHTLFGLNTVFMHPIFSFAASGFCSYTADKTVSGAVQAEGGIRYRFMGIHTGGNYTGANAVNWDGKRRNEQAAAFVQPYIKAGLFSSAMCYTFSMEDHTLFHNGGLIAQVKHNIIRWKASWDYRNELHTVKTEITCTSVPTWFTGVQWFQKAATAGSIELQDRSTNPFVLKKYSIRVDGVFCIRDGIFCGISGSLSQSIRKKETKTERLIYLQHPVYGGVAFISFKRNGIGKIHSGKLEVSVKNQKPYYDVKIGYQIRGK